MKFEQNWLRRSRLKMLTDAWMDDGRKVITIAHPEHSSGELKITPFHWVNSILSHVWTLFGEKKYLIHSHVAYGYVHHIGKYWFNP